MKTLLTIFFLTFSGFVFGWGQVGHRVVGQIASELLTKEAALQVNSILKGNSLARASTWADEIKSNPDTYKYTFNWHYTTWPQDVDVHDESLETPATGFLLKSISDEVRVLKDKNSTPDQKEFALKFIVHLVGDLHTPLHVGNGSDLGGNNCMINFQNRVMNLHALWDQGLIESTNLSFTEMTKFIMDGKTSSDFLAAKKGGLVDWALESKKIVALLYPANVVAPKTPVSLLTYCHKEALPEEMPRISYEYSAKFIPVIEKRLFEAGVRLAMILNEALN